MFEILKPGLQTTMQDAGRRVRALGIPAGGAADSVALRLANALVGNPPDAAALEVTLAGPTVRFHAPAVVSLCGAPFEATLDGVAFPLWRAVQVEAGQTLAIGGTAQGMRAVLAVRGGLEGQEVFGSRSTDLRSQFGGLAGRAVQKGDQLDWPERSSGPVKKLVVAPELRTPVGPRHLIRVMPTADASASLLAYLRAKAFTVSAQADRMGARLTQTLEVPHDPARVSLPNVPGMVQVPPDGRPIVLLADAGTHGGYPTPLIVIQADLARGGQLRPGDQVVFSVVNWSQAQAALAKQEDDLRQAENALRCYWQGG